MKLCPFLNVGVRLSKVKVAIGVLPQSVSWGQSVPVLLPALQVPNMTAYHMDSLPPDILSLPLNFCLLLRRIPVIPWCQQHRSKCSYLVFVCFVSFETWSNYVALTFLEVAMYTRQSSNSQISMCFLEGIQIITIKVCTTMPGLSRPFLVSSVKVQEHIHKFQGSRCLQGAYFACHSLLLT